MDTICNLENKIKNIKSFHEFLELFKVYPTIDVLELSCKVFPIDKHNTGGKYTPGRKFWDALSSIFGIDNGDETKRNKLTRNILLNAVNEDNFQNRDEIFKNIFFSLDKATVQAQMIYILNYMYLFPTKR